MAREYYEDGIVWVEEDPQDDEFNAFLAQVDEHLTKLVGCPSEMLPDYDYWQSFSCGDSPKHTAELAIEHAKTYC